MISFALVPLGPYLNADGSTTTRKPATLPSAMCLASLVCDKSASQCIAAVDQIRRWNYTHERLAVYVMINFSPARCSDSMAEDRPVIDPLSEALASQQKRCLLPCSASEQS